MRFTIDIKMGNDLMRNATHLKDALHRVSQELDSDVIRLAKAGIPVEANIWDINGNTVGSWKLTKEEK